MKNKKYLILGFIAVFIIGLYLGNWSGKLVVREEDENCYYNAGRLAMSNCLDYFCGEGDINCNSSELNEKGKLCDIIVFKGTIFEDNLKE